MLGKVTSAISRAGGDIGAIDLIQPGGPVRTRGITPNARDERHGQAIVAGLTGIRGVRVLHVSDRTFLMHLGGKIEVHGKVPVKTRDDFSMAYAPGVARVCMAIHEDPEKAYTLTIKQNSVAVVTDGTAVLGLGDIGPRAAMPVTEGKALLFKAFADVDAYPLCLGDQGHGRDREDRPRGRAGLREDQPGGHRRSPVLRDRGAPAEGRNSTSRSSTTTSTGPRWSCSPRS